MKNIHVVTLASVAALFSIQVASACNEQSICQNPACPQRQEYEAFGLADRLHTAPPISEEAGPQVKRLRAGNTASEQPNIATEITPSDPAQLPPEQLRAHYQALVQAGGADTYTLKQLGHMCLYSIGGPFEELQATSYVVNHLPTDANANLQLGKEIAKGNRTNAFPFLKVAYVNGATHAVVDELVTHFVGQHLSQTIMEQMEGIFLEQASSYPPALDGLMRTFSTIPPRKLGERRSRYKTALGLIRQAAGGGNVEAQYLAGAALLLSTRGQKKNFEAGLGLLRQASIAGNSKAIAMLLDKLRKRDWLNQHEILEATYLPSYMPITPQILSSLNNEVVSYFLQKVKSGELLLQLDGLFDWLITRVNTHNCGLSLDILMDYYGPRVANSESWRNSLIRTLTTAPLLTRRAAEYLLAQINFGALSTNDLLKAQRVLTRYFLTVPVETHGQAEKKFLTDLAIAGGGDPAVYATGFVLKQHLENKGAYARAELPELLRILANRFHKTSIFSVVTPNFEHDFSLEKLQRRWFEAVLNGAFPKPLREAAFSLLLETDHTFSEQELIGISINDHCKNLVSKVQFAARCLPKHDISSALETSINVLRLGDPAPALENVESVDQEAFINLLAQTMETCATKDPRVAKRIQDKLLAESKALVEGAKTSLAVYFSPTSSVDSLLRSQFHWLAGNLMSISDEIEKETEISLFVNNLQGCRTGGKEAVEHSYHRRYSRLALVHPKEGSENPSAGSTHTQSAAQGVTSGPFNTLMDRFVRQIKFEIVEQKILADPSMPRDIRDQRVHLTASIKTIIGKDIGLWAQGMEPLLDPMITNPIEVAFRYAGAASPKEWKPFLLKEFLFYYTPDTLTTGLRDKINAYMVDQKTQTDVQDIFANQGLNIHESFFEEPPYDPNPNVRYLPTKLTDAGARALLVIYQYLHTPIVDLLKDDDEL